MSLLSMRAGYTPEYLSRKCTRELRQLLARYPLKASPKGKVETMHKLEIDRHHARLMA